MDPPPAANIKPGMAPVPLFPSRLPLAARCARRQLVSAEGVVDLPCASVAISPNIQIPMGVWVWVCVSYLHSYGATQPTLLEPHQRQTVNKKRKLQPRDLLRKYHANRRSRRIRPLPPTKHVMLLGPCRLVHGQLPLLGLPGHAG